MAAYTEDRKKNSPLIRIHTKQPPTQFGNGDQIGTNGTLEVDLESLIAELKANVEGEVRFDDGSRALYATDASNYRQIPIGLVVPKTKRDVIATIAACRKYGAPIVSRGGGTSLAGQGCNVAVIIDYSKYYNEVLWIDPERRLGGVQPGCVLDNFRGEAEKSGITFGPDPATHDHNTLGGMIGNDSCGIHSIMAALEGDGARTADNIAEMEILLYDGTILRVGATSEEELEKIIQQGGRRGDIYKRLRDLRDKHADQIREKFVDIPRRVSGFNLPYLLPENGFNLAAALVGTEGTCITVLEATMKLVPNPKERTLLVLGYTDVFAAGDDVPEIMKHKPIGLEGMDDLLIEFMKKKGLHPADVKLLPDGNGWLLVEFGGESKEDADAKAKNLMSELKKRGDKAPTFKLFDDDDEEKMLWQVRESGLGATAHIPGEPMSHPGWEDSAVPPDKVGDYLRKLKALFHKYNYKASLYGHFGQGCIHCRIPFDLFTADGIEQFKSFMNEAADLVVSLGGSLSGEHGDGQARAELLPKMFGNEIVAAFQEFKSIFDPDWKMNPGKVVDPFPIDVNLRVSNKYEPWQPETHFKYPDDKGSFANATLRCVGVGKCRRGSGEGTMCPSYMVTFEEKDSTRGRARLLFEMLEGDAIGKDGWRDEAVKDALDLCLACKGCKGDCPVNVDMATYKAEFLSHYYEGKIRPRHAFAFGFINKWANLASIAPLVANFFTSTPILRNLAKLTAGVAPERSVPQFAPQTFRDWFELRSPKSKVQSPKSKPEVILWADTFNNHFHPTTAQAAVEVLEAAGFHVKVPRQKLCCGRPLYDYGFLDEAKAYLKNTLDALRKEIEAGTPVVVLEPSCAAVFRDELINLLPNDEDAKRLNKQTFLLSEFLIKYAKDFELPKLHRKALVHGHCHHKSLMKMDDEKEILKKMELDFEMPDTGCCGMAGAFGFEKGEHYDVSIKCGERVLLPETRKVAKDILVITDGFSCREQISQTTDRKGLHLAQVIKMALDEGEKGTLGDYPEEKFLYAETPASEIVKTATIAGVGALAIGGAAYWAFKRFNGSKNDEFQKS